jgi:hypothetical protein
MTASIIPNSFSFTGSCIGMEDFGHQNTTITRDVALLEQKAAGSSAAGGP